MPKEQTVSHHLVLQTVSLKKLNKKRTLIKIKTLILVNGYTTNNKKSKSQMDMAVISLKNNCFNIEDILPTVCFMVQEPCTNYSPKENHKSFTRGNGLMEKNTEWESIIMAKAHIMKAIG